MIKQHVLRVHGRATVMLLSVCRGNLADKLVRKGKGGSTKARNRGVKVGCLTGVVACRGRLAFYCSMGQATYNCVEGGGYGRQGRGQNKSINRNKEQNTPRSSNSIMLHNKSHIK